MGSLPEELKRSLDQYDSMQTDHLRIFSKTAGPQTLDLKTLNFQRSRAFEDLKNQLRRVMKKQPEAVDPADTQAYAGRLEKIINREKSIAGLAEKYREEMNRQKCRMRRGKKALQGYGTACMS